MATKKKEGLDGLKVIKGGTRREDRQINAKTNFDPITISANNALTVVCMLKSPENDVVTKALASLDTFASKAESNLKLLTSLDIVQYLLPLISHNDFVVKRFAQKLIGELCSVEEFRQQLLEEENILNTFADILEKEKDVVIHEYTALALAYLTTEYEVAATLLQVENFTETLFTRVVSADPDVEKNCLEIMSHLLDDVHGIEYFIEAPNFKITPFLTLTSSRYPVIQSLAIDVLTKLTSWCRDPKIVMAFRDAQGCEIVLSVLENIEWRDLHEKALDLMVNVADNPDLCDYLLQSGCLLRVTNLLDNLDVPLSNQKIFGVLARMSQTKKGREALTKLNMVEKFCESLRDQPATIQEAACLGIANISQYGPALEKVLEANPVPDLIELITDEENNTTIRNLAAYALNLLCNEDIRIGNLVLNCETYEGLTNVLNNNQDLPAELCKNVIQIFTGISLDETLRNKIVSENVISALLSCLQGRNIYPVKDTSLQVDALECLASLLIENEAILNFLGLNGMTKLLGCLRSKFASLREWGGHLVVVGAQSMDFIKIFINLGGLNWLFGEKNTRYSMPSWEAAMEAIFSRFLPAKFAYRGRLDTYDITEDGFYVFSRRNVQFFLLEKCFQSQCVPLFPVYFVNFSSSEEPSSSITENFPDNNEEIKEKTEVQTPRKRTMTIDVAPDKHDISTHLFSTNAIVAVPFSEEESTQSFESDQFKHFAIDPNLSIYLADLKMKIAKEESAFGDAGWRSVHPTLIRERARIIAEFVAEEMAGTNPNKLCSSQEKEKHISELKFQLGTNILPLGLIKTGSYLERAVLFKVLADRIGFPCALVRNEYGKTWIEIAVPVINVENPEENRVSGESIINLDRKSSIVKAIIEPQYVASAYTFQGEADATLNHWFPRIKPEYYKGLPSQCMKTNAIVDLVDEPGKIIILNSFEAEEYLTTPRA